MTKTKLRSLDASDTWEDLLRANSCRRRWPLGRFLRDHLWLEHQAARWGQIAFDDAAGEVSGTWLTERPPSSQPGLLLYINVEDVQRALQKIVEAGGEIVTPLTPQGEGEAFATFRDPAGNVLGVFHEGGMAGR